MDMLFFMDRHLKNCVRQVDFLKNHSCHGQIKKDSFKRRVEDSRNKEDKWSIAQVRVPKVRQ